MLLDVILLVLIFSFVGRDNFNITNVNKEYSLGRNADVMESDDMNGYENNFVLLLLNTQFKTGGLGFTHTLYMNLVMARWHAPGRSNSVNM